MRPCGWPLQRHLSDIHSATGASTTLSKPSSKNPVTKNQHSPSIGAGVVGAAVVGAAVVGAGVAGACDSSIQTRRRIKQMRGVIVTTSASGALGEVHNVWRLVDGTARFSVRNRVSMLGVERMFPGDTWMQIGSCVSRPPSERKCSESVRGLLRRCFSNSPKRKKGE